jgi:rsbT antagonist protein RsbS
MGEFLLATIQVDMQDQLALRLQDDLTQAISKHGAKGVLIDISALEMVDSFIGRMISDISGMARILDAKTVLVGMQPAVASPWWNSDYRCRALPPHSTSSAECNC